jgi:hypothetical protein
MFRCVSLAEWRMSMLGPLSMSGEIAPFALTKPNLDAPRSISLGK